jgi:hypothetical protein
MIPFFIKCHFFVPGGSSQTSSSFSFSSSTEQVSSAQHLFFCCKLLGVLANLNWNLEGDLVFSLFKKVVSQAVSLLSDLSSSYLYPDPNAAFNPDPGFFLIRTQHQVYAWGQKKKKHLQLILVNVFFCIKRCYKDKYLYLSRENTLLLKHEISSFSTLFFYWFFGLPGPGSASQSENLYFHCNVVRYSLLITYRVSVPGTVPVNISLGKR